MALAYFSRMPGVVERKRGPGVHAQGVVPGCPLPKLSGSPADRKIPLLGRLIPLLGRQNSAARQRGEFRAGLNGLNYLQGRI
jgi:hypothetical protein